MVWCPFLSAGRLSSLPLQGGYASNNPLGSTYLGVVPFDLICPASGWLTFLPDTLENRYLRSCRVNSQETVGFGTMDSQRPPSMTVLVYYCSGSGMNFDKNLIFLDI